MFGILNIQRVACLFIIVCSRLLNIYQSDSFFEKPNLTAPWNLALKHIKHGSEVKWAEIEAENHYEVTKNDQKCEFIIEMIDYFHSVNDGSFYMVLPWLDGDSVYQRYTKFSRIPDDKTILEIAFQALTAFDYLHARKISHCDVKPENLQFKNAGNRLQLIDFGSSEWFNNAHKNRQVCLYQYQAPEIILELDLFEKNSKCSETKFYKKLLKI